MKRNRPRVVIRKILGRSKAWGQHWSDGLIEIDPRQNQKQFLNTLLHELFHEYFPDAGEK